MLSPGTLTFRRQGNETEPYRELRRNSWRYDGNQERVVLWKAKESVLRRRGPEPCQMRLTGQVGR